MPNTLVQHFTTHPTYTSAQTSSKPKVLVLYSTQDDKVSNNVQILNTQLGHFTNDITVKT